VRKFRTSSAQSNQIVYKTTDNALIAPTSPSPTSRRHTEALPPLADGVDDLRQRFEILHEAVPEVVAVLRTEFERQNDLLRREIDVMRRELDVARRAQAMSA
jgi:hypothetical protein